MEEGTLSAALARQMKALCLSSFPCGTGSWSSQQARKESSPESDDLKEESQDSVKDLLGQHGSPWKLEDSFGPEAQKIREMASAQPGPITDHFIHSYFRSLRVVDQEVTEVDDALLTFHNLEELVLSANKLQTVSSSNLPQTLKVLELCSNHISGLKDLTVSPPPGLQHLGLSYNRIQGASENRYLTVDFWPNLVSLDVSFNNLTALYDLIPKLATLDQLRILVLQGNPLTFLPTYRGYTIDSLPKLCVLDDIPILPDERHKYAGLSKQTESLATEAKLFVRIGKVLGLPNPGLPTETQEYPITTISYHVCYEFIQDQEELPPDMLQLQDMTTEARTPNSHFSTGLYQTDGLPWSEAIDYEYEKEHSVADLLALKRFLLSGMRVTVTEEKILSWPLDAEQNPTESKQEKKVAGKDKEKEKARTASRASKAGSKNKKKKENLDHLHHDPPVVRTLGYVIISLESLVSGETQTCSVCDFGVVSTDTEQSQLASNKGLQEEKKQYLKSGSEGVETPKTSRLSAKRKHAEAVVKPTEEEPHSLPLTADISVGFMQCML
ncbi:leucine-rich repeat-containing protein 43 [Gastrophryne carolinensis]